MKGIIADIKDNRAILIADGKFINIPDKGYSVGQTIEYNERSYTHLLKAVSAAAAAVVLSVGGYKAYFTPYSCIDIDINPSVRVEINIMDRVISMKPLNDDAVRLLEVCPKQSGSIDACLEQIISESEKLGFLSTDNNSINMEIVSTHKKPFEAASRYSGTYIADGIEIVGAVQSADKETLEKAKELDISVGRLKAIQSYSDAYGGDSENNAKALNELPVKEIKQLVKEKPADNASGKAPVRESRTASTAESEVKAEKSIKNNSGTTGSTKSSGTKKNTSVPVSLPTPSPSASFAALPDNKPARPAADRRNQADETAPVIKQPQWSNPELPLSVPAEAPAVSENDRDEGTAASDGTVKLPRPDFGIDKADKNEAESNENKSPVNGNKEEAKPESDDREGNKGGNPDTGYGDNDRDDDEKNNDRDDVTDNDRDNDRDDDRDDDRDNDRDDEKIEHKPDNGENDKKPSKEPDEEGTQNKPSEGDSGVLSSEKSSSSEKEGTQNKPSKGEAKPSINEKPSFDGKPEGESKPTVNEKPSSDGKPEGGKPTVNEKPSFDEKPEGGSKPSVNEKPSGEKSSKEKSSSGKEGTQNKSSETSGRSFSPAEADKQSKPDGASFKAPSNDKALMDKKP